MERIIDWKEDVMGFCTECIRMRWLRLVTDEKIPSGVCRQCRREAGDAPPAG